MSRIRLAFILSLAIPTILSAQSSPEREWTSSDGKTISAALVASADGEVTLRRSDGQRFNLPMSRLSEADQAFVTQLIADASRAKGLEEGPFADKVADEWVVVPKSEYGLLFQLYGSKKLSRLKEPFPLFIHLHGAGARANEVEAGKVEIAAEQLAKEDQYDDTPCLIFVPTCPPDVFWGDQVDEMETVIDALVESLPIDRNRIYLSGYSMGARGIGSLLESRPNFYAGAMFADGEAKMNWVETIDTPMWLAFSGERDLAGAEAFAKAYQAAGKEAHFDGQPEKTHNQIHWHLAKDEAVFPWMFAQSRGTKTAETE